MYDLLSYYGLVNMRINASDKDLPVKKTHPPQEFIKKTLPRTDLPDFEGMRVQSTF
jgi:hypothetical protein